MKRPRRHKPLFLAIIASAIAIAVHDWSAAVLAHKKSSVGARASLPATSVQREQPEHAPHALRAKMPALQSLANHPLAFEANEGQADSHIKFLAREAGAALLLASNQAILQLSQSALSFRFAGANGSPNISGALPL